MSKEIGCFSSALLCLESFVHFMNVSSIDAYSKQVINVKLSS